MSYANLLTEANALLPRIDALEAAMPDTYESMIAEANLLSVRVDALEVLPPLPSGGNAHFDSLSSSPSLIKAMSLRTLDQWTERRNWSGTEIVIDPVLDAARFIIPPLKNEGGGFMHRWGIGYPWNVGDKLVVQHDFMLNAALFVSNVGEKFTNLCRSANSQITYELRPSFAINNPCPVDLRCYLPKMEGRQERPELASDVADPTRTYIGSGGGYDRNPGPDSTWPYSGSDAVPANAFTILPDEWCRVTYEIERQDVGARIKVWLATESRNPALIIASPVNPSLGFHVSQDRMIDSFYAELDSSQERTYTVPQPERWAAFRNLIVLSNVTGDSVLGGKPTR